MSDKRKPQLLPTPPKLDPAAPVLPPATNASGVDLLMEALLGPLGLGTADDPEQVTPGSPAWRSLTRAGAAGEMAGAGMALLKAPQLYRNLDNIITFLPERLRDGIGELLQRAPRTAGHLSGIQEADFLGNATGGFATSEALGMDPAESIGRIALNSVLGKKGTTFDQVLTGAHEMTHAAQAIRNPGGFDKAYDALNEFGGYERNPFETRARVAGLNQANRAFWDARNTAEQPLIPGLIRRQDIKKWAEGASKPEFESPTNLGNVELRLQGGPAEPGWLENQRRLVLRERFGASPSGHRQQKLPLDTTSPAGPEFTAVGDEPPYIPPARKEPSRYPDQIPYREPRFSKPIIGDTGAPIVDAPEFKSMFGREVKLRLGDNPAIIYPQGRGKGTAGEVVAVPQEVMNNLILELGRRRRGYGFDATGRKHHLPNKP